MGTSKVLIQAEDDEGNIQKLYDAAFYLNIFVGIILFLVVFFFQKNSHHLFSASIRLCDKSHVCTNIVVLIVFCSKCH